MNRDEEYYGVYRRPEHLDLPGQPRRQLLKDVRRVLWRYGIRPNTLESETWRAAWEWAYQISQSYSRGTWPSGDEIATQYILLLLARMKADFRLRLPHRAGKELATAARAILLPANRLALTDGRKDA